MSSEFKFKAFISYSHADVKWAKWLHRTLEAYRTPKRLLAQTSEQDLTVPARLSPVFRDREEFASSHDLSESIRVALEESENLIVICSPKAAASKWVNQEIESFKKLGRQQRIFYLIVAGDPAATGTEQDCFPPAVHQSYDVAGNPTDNFIDPIAADVREHGDGKALARLKIIAGLLHVGLDELRQREQQRKNRRMFVISASSICASIITIGLAINATLARDEAERRQQQAEELLGFMVGDLRSSLEPIGRLDLLESVGQQAMDYFATVNVNELSDEELLRQSQVMTQLGEIRFDQLLYEQALSAFAQAYERSAELYIKNPADGERLFNRSQAEYWVGFSNWRSGDIGSALNWWTQYRDSALELVSIDPSNEDWLREVGWGHHNLAVLELDAGNYARAIEGFESEIQILDALLEESQSLEIIYDKADAFSWLGNAYLEQGQISDALANYKFNTDTLRQLTDLDERNSQWLRALAFSLQILAEVTALTGDITNALVANDEAKSLFSSLTTRDSENVNWRRGSNQSTIIAGYLAATGQQWDDAKRSAISSIELLNDMVDNGLDDRNIRYLLASSNLLLAWVGFEEGEFKTSLQATQSGLQHIIQFEEFDLINNERLGTWASLLILQGEAYAALGDQQHAIEAWDSSIDLLKVRISSSSSLYLLEPWCRVLFLTNDHQNYFAVRRKLDELFFKPLRALPP